MTHWNLNSHLLYYYKNSTGFDVPTNEYENNVYGEVKC